MAKSDIFISYRRDGGDMVAMNLYQTLKRRGYRVFYDLEVLRAGNFSEELYRHIRSCKDFIIILTPGALDRCNSEDDWVRMEIAEALNHNKNIIPFMLNGFTFPEFLPPDIDEIRYQNGLSTQAEYFNESVRRLCGRYLVSKPVPKEKKPNIGFFLCMLLFVGAVAGLIVYFIFYAQTPAAPSQPAQEEMTELVTGMISPLWTLS
ncbi:MAG: toll/interleukin-1 receptor domain-containing protein [Clostridia bacterium]|nr:toll/interleukin-1 receptor domain-containing protein [Clostridia bacterium]